MSKFMFTGCSILALVNMCIQLYLHDSAWMGWACALLGWMVAALYSEN